MPSFIFAMHENYLGPYQKKSWIDLNYFKNIWKIQTITGKEQAQSKGLAT